MKVSFAKKICLESKLKDDVFLRKVWKLSTNLKGGRWELLTFFGGWLFFLDPFSFINGYAFMVSMMPGTRLCTYQTDIIGWDNRITIFQDIDQLGRGMSQVPMVL